MTFSKAYVDFIENIIILIAITLWELCYGMFSFLQVSEVEGLLSYHGNIKRRTCYAHHNIKNSMRK